MTENRSNPEQFQLRLPPGLRDRIKAYASKHGRSTNTEIVRVLEREFPEPVSIEHRISELEEMVEILQGAATNASVDRLLRKISETIEGISSGEIYGLTQEEYDKFDQRYAAREIEQNKISTTDKYNLDPDERDIFLQTGRTEKYVWPKSDE